VAFLLSDRSRSILAARRCKAFEKRMIRRDPGTTVVYPALGSEFDLWFMRLSGHGLGNCFYSYFHAVVLAEPLNAKIVSPPWLSVKIGPLLRGADSKRFYWRMFKPFPGEIYGQQKLFALLSRYHKRTIVDVSRSAQPALVEGALNVVSNRKFTFQGLHQYRELIRERLLGIVNDPVPKGHCWGQGGYIAVHIRLGDFATVADPKVISGGRTNTRIPLSWYINLVRVLQKRYGDRPIYIFSDGKEQELQPLLALGAKLYRSGSDMTDLLAMSAASIMVGSNSTYSRWAVFLGNMPSIWVKKDVEEERPSDPATPILYVPIDDPEPALWPREG
jgi:hypothetical protein